jgi:hypothetical protein
MAFIIAYDLVVPFPDRGVKFHAGQMVTEDDVPKGSWVPMVNTGQIVSADGHVLDPITGESTAEDLFADLGVRELGLSKTIADKLERQGLFTRQAVVDFARANSGFPDVLTDKQAEQVVAAIQATEKKDDGEGEEAADGEGDSDTEEETETGE